MHHLRRRTERVSCGAQLAADDGWFGALGYILCEGVPQMEMASHAGQQGVPGRSSMHHFISWATKLLITLILKP